MGYATAQAAVASQPDAAGKLSAGQATIYNWRSVFISYRTLDALLGAGKTDAVQAFVKSQSPRYDGYMAVPGDPAGNAGGVDLSRGDVQALVAALPAATAGAAVPVVQADCDAILNLARSSPRAQWQDWGVDQWDATTVARLGYWVMWEAMAADVTAWADLANTRPEVFAGMLGIDPSAVAAKRDAMVAVVQQWKSSLQDAGSTADFTTMPATAAAVWARVK